MRNANSLIFSRQTCLFAIEEILQSDLVELPEFKISENDNWQKLLNYLLSVNSEITSIKKANPEEPIDFERLNPKMIPINELMLISDPFYTVYRGLRLFEYLNEHSLLGPIFKEYFIETYDIEYQRFLYEILRMLIGNEQDVKAFDFVYNFKNEEFIHLFNSLSKKIVSADIFKLLNIKKYPFFESQKDQFFLLDNASLADKVYIQFINDFWFDKVKSITDAGGKNVFNIKGYKSTIGYFFEQYVKEKFNYSFENAKYYVLRMFDELVVESSQGRIEIADIYLRKNSKIIIGQVKSSTIYDEEKYGGDINSLYKNDRQAFFKNFGIDQLVESIKKLDSAIPFVDAKFPANKSYQVYPIIIFSEKALQTPLMAKIFEERFRELMVDFKNQKVHVFPVCLIHISDLEQIEEFLNNDYDAIWDLLHYHVRYPKFMPPFYNSIAKRNIHSSYKYIQRTINNSLINKFNDGKDMEA